MQTNSIKIDRVAAMDLINTRHAFPTESKDIDILPFSAPPRKQGHFELMYNGR